MKIAVVIPVYNQIGTIGTVFNRVLNSSFDTEVIVVDDASTDGTQEFLTNLNQPQVKVLFHFRNQGKGAALRLGFASAASPYIFVQDADLEYDPADYHSMIIPLLDGRADMVYGSRFLGSPNRVLFCWHYVVNRLLTLLSNMITNLNLSDMETGQKAFRTKSSNRSNSPVSGSLLNRISGERLRALSGESMKCRYLIRAVLMKKGTKSAGATL